MIIKSLGTWDNYDKSRMEEMNPKEFKKLSKIKDLDKAELINSLIKDKKIYLMDKEHMLIWEASCVIGYKKNGKYCNNCS